MKNCKFSFSLQKQTESKEKEKHRNPPVQCLECNHHMLQNYSNHPIAMRIKCKDFMSILQIKVGYHIMLLCKCKTFFFFFSFLVWILFSF